MWFGVSGAIAAQEADRTAEAMASATAAVREVFGEDADVALAQPVLSMAPGAGAIRAAVPEPGSRTGGAVRFVLYGQQADRRVRLGRLTAHVRVRARHVRTVERIEARAVVTGGTVTTVHDDIGRLPIAPLPTLDATTGAVTRRALGPGEVIASAVLVPRPLVRVGDEVVTIARVGPVEVRGRAVAAQAGELGETVVVVNPDSHRRLRARVVAEQTVEVGHGS